MEQVTYHVHVHLDIYVDGQPVPVPANIGIRSNCIFWLHTHDTTGILHVEAPSPASYTLGQFFQVWGQRLDNTHLLDRAVDDHHEIRTFVSGQPFGGSPETVPLTAHAVVVVEYGPPFVPPPAYVFPSGS